MLQLNIQISSQSQNYPIFIDEGLIQKLAKLVDLSIYSKLVIITDKTVAKFWLQKLLENLYCQFDSSKICKIIIPSGEEAKNLVTVEYLWQKMTENNLDRKSLVLCLGGGVVGDLGGFAAATYMRGLDFVQIPTTLLAQVDSSVGGKTGFDFSGLKNNIGVFAQPKAVIIDTLTLQTLPKRDFRAGFGEVIKYSIAQDLNFFEFLENLDDWKNLTGDKLSFLINKCCSLKAEIVQKDEKESLGLRKILNFGHTFGHSLEMFSFTANQKSLLHGEAVSLGIIVATKISLLQGLIKQKDFLRIKNLIKKFELPTTYFYKNKAKKNLKELLFKLIQSDKKNVDNQIKWVLIEQIGKAKIDQIVTKERIFEAMDEVLERA